MAMPAKVNLKEAVKLKLNHNLTCEQIAKLQGCSKSAVHKQLQSLLPTQTTELYQKNKADILSEAQLKVILNMDPERLKSASLNNLAYTFQNLFNCERLERGQSTQNIDVHLEQSDLKVLEARRLELQKQLTERVYEPDNTPE